jgi:hypothetical protein
LAAQLDDGIADTFLAAATEVNLQRTNQYEGIVDTIVQLF